ncbi:MAG: hypothetical protein AAGA68_19725 [Pseudomonadota bacterium]
MEVATLLLAIVLAFAAGIAGGAIGGVAVGGKHIGNDLAAMMGGFYGPLAALPGIALALIILTFL